MKWVSFMNFYEIFFQSDPGFFPIISSNTKQPLVFEVNLIYSLKFFNLKFEFLVFRKPTNMRIIA